MSLPGGRRARLSSCALALAALLAGCSGAPGQEAPALDARRAAVISFWETMNGATSLRRQERFEEAARLYEKALAHDPRHEDALYYLGHCLRESGDPQGARGAFERLIEVNPGSARGQMAMGALLSLPGPSGLLDLPEAETHFRRAHEINKEETGPMLRLAEVLLAEGEIEEARAWLAAAFSHNPKCVEAPFLTGYTYWSEGDLPRARASYLAAARAATPDKPVKGVLSEGDRVVTAADGAKKPAPPLAAPMGETLFGAFSAPLKLTAGDQEGHFPQPDLDDVYAPVRRFVEELSRR